MKIKGNFETLFFVSIQECLYPNAAVHEPECLIFRRHQPKKLKVELESTIPHPLYAIVVPLRLLALRNSNPAKWDLAQDLDSHLEERYNDAKFLFVIATAMPILRACGVSEDDINLVAKILGIGWCDYILEITTLTVIDLSLIHI